MQEVFEDISRKLVYADDIYRYIKTEINPYGRPFKGSVYEFGLKIMEYIKNMSAAYDADKIVEQVAAEYNNGWIPCSECLPENISTVVVQVKEIEKPTFGWFGNMTGWRLTEKDFTELKDFIVVAWQPLPESYRPKGE